MIYGGGWALFSCVRSKLPRKGLKDFVKFGLRDLLGYYVTVWLFGTSKESFNSERTSVAEPRVDEEGFKAETRPNFDLTAAGNYSETFLWTRDEVYIDVYETLLPQNPTLAPLPSKRRPQPTNRSLWRGQMSSGLSEMDLVVIQYCFSDFGCLFSSYETC